MALLGLRLTSSRGPSPQLLQLHQHRQRALELAVEVGLVAVEAMTSSGMALMVGPRWGRRNRGRRWLPTASLRRC